MRIADTNVIKGLVSDPSEANGTDIFNFGEIYEFSHDQCEAVCEAQSGCVAYTQFASWYHVSRFFAFCMGRSNAFNVNEADSATLCGLEAGMKCNSFN